MNLGLLIVLLIFIPLFIREIIMDPLPKWEGSGIPRGGASPAEGMVGESNMVDAAMFMNINE